MATDEAGGPGDHEAIVKAPNLMMRSSARRLGRAGLVLAPRALAGALRRSVRASSRTARRPGSRSRARSRLRRWSGDLLQDFGEELGAQRDDEALAEPRRLTGHLGQRLGKRPAQGVLAEQLDLGLE